MGRPPEPHCCCDSCHRRVTWNGVNTLHSSPGVGNPGRDSRTKIEVSGRGDRVHPGGPRRSPGPAFSLLPLHATRAPQPETSELRLRSLGSHQSETPFPQRCLAFKGFQRGGVTPGARPGRPCLHRPKTPLRAGELPVELRGDQTHAPPKTTTEAPRMTFSEPHTWAWGCLLTRVLTEMQTKCPGRNGKSLVILRTKKNHNGIEAITCHQRRDESDIEII